MSGLASVGAHGGTSTGGTWAGRTPPPGGTVRRLWLAGALGVLGALLLAALGGLALQVRSSALAGADLAAGQVVRLEKVRTALATAQAAAVTSDLLSGQATAAQRTAQQQAYQSALAEAVGELTAAGAAGAGGLGPVAEAVTGFAASSATAEADARAGDAAGAQSYRQRAQQLLDGPVGTGLDARVASYQRQLEADLSDPAWWWLGLGLGLGLAGLLAAQVELARRSHRVVSVPAALGTLALVGVAVLGGLTLDSSGARAQQARYGAFTAVRDASAARTALAQARAAESSALITRSTAPAADPAFTAAQRRFTAAVAALPRFAAGGPDADLVRRWQDGHQAVQQALAGTGADGWARARQIATGTAGAGAPDQPAAFDALDAALSSVVAARSADLHAALTADRGRLLVLPYLVLLVGVLAAVGLATGVARRLAEYR